MRAMYRSQFNLCNNDFVKGFIVVRTYEHVPKQVSSEKVPPRKSQRVLTALDLKGKKIMLKILTEELSTTPGTGTNRELVLAPEIILLSSEQKPSYFLKKASGRVLICETIKGVVLMEPQPEVCEQLCDEADGCFELVKTRFENTFCTKNAENKRTHYGFLWVSENIARVIATMIFFGMISKNVHRFRSDKNTCLLALLNTASLQGGVFIFARSDVTEVLEGNYLYFDTAKSEWVRSGKACGLNSNFGIREKQHIGLSKDPSKSTMQFCQAYPDEGTDQQCLLQRGFFQYLEQYCGLSFEMGKHHALLANSEGGILQWDAATLSHFKATMKRRLEE